LTSEYSKYKNMAHKMDETNYQKEKPLGVAIVICEKVITEAQSNNKTLVSTFNHIRAKTLPCRHPRMAIYVALTNGSGEKKVELVFKLGNRAMMKLGGKIKFQNPNHVIELVFDLRSVVFPEPGLYAFEVFADDEYVFESRFNVTLEQEK
jgi:hypothetical protein